MYHLNNIIQTYVRKINRENSDFTHRVYYSDNVVALQSPIINDVTYRFQVDSRNGGIILYKSEDNGVSWVRNKEILSNADMQSGVVTVNAVANGTTEFTVNFPETFAKLPVVVMSVVTSRPDLRSVEPLSRDTKKVTGAVYNGTSASTVSVFWIAVAK